MIAFNSLSILKSAKPQDTDKHKNKNSFIAYNDRINEACSFVIPSKSSMPDELYMSDKTEKKNSLLSNALVPLVLTPLVLLGGGCLLSQAMKKTAVNKLKILAEKTENHFLPAVGRNININDDDKFLLYLCFQEPTRKNFLVTGSIILVSGAAFIMKNFVDGFKDIWVKKQEAKIEKEFQDNSIEIETRSFSGKNQINRSLLAEKAEELKAYLPKDDKNSFSNILFTAFRLNRSKCDKNISFKSENKTAEKDQIKKTNSLKENLVYSAIGLLTLGLSAFFVAKTLKNFSCVAKKFEQTKENLTSKVKDSAGSFNVMPVELGGNPNRIGYYSYGDEFTSHLYTWLTAPSQFTRDLFLAITGYGALNYVGIKTVEGVKEVQVKKQNRKTDLELKDKLVNTHLKEFVSKKSSIITPLVEEFKESASKGKDSKELNKMYEGVLEEIKYGPPYIYE